MKKNFLNNSKYLLILIAIFAFLLLHIFAHYEINQYISMRAIAGIAIILTFTLHRLFIIAKEKKIQNILDDPFQNCEVKEETEHSIPVFKSIQIHTSKLIKSLIKELVAIYPNFQVFKKSEKKYFSDKIVEYSANILFTLFFIGVLANYRKLIVSFGVIGIGLALFFGIFAASYVTRNFQKLVTLIQKRKETKFTRLYKKAIRENKIKPTDKALFFKNWILQENISACVISNNDGKNISFDYIIFDKYILEYSNKKLSNGMYFNTDYFYDITPVSEKLVEYIKTFTEQTEILNKEEQDFIFKGLSLNV